MDGAGFGLPGLRLRKHRQTVGPELRLQVVRGPGVCRRSRLHSPDRSQAGSPDLTL